MRREEGIIKLKKILKNSEWTRIRDERRRFFEEEVRIAGFDNWRWKGDLLQLKSESLSEIPATDDDVEKKPATFSGGSRGYLWKFIPAYASLVETVSDILRKKN